MTDEPGQLEDGLYIEYEEVEVNFFYCFQYYTVAKCTYVNGDGIHRWGLTVPFDWDNKKELIEAKCRYNIAALEPIE